MEHIIIESKNGVYRRLDENLCEVSMKTGARLRYGMTFSDMEQIEKRGFKVVDRVPANVTFRWGYYWNWRE